MATDNYGLQGKRVVLTGGAGGLGLPMALALLREGASVLLTALEEEALTRAAAQCRQLGSGTSYTVAADLSRSEAVEDILAAADRHMGGVDVLINNAGLGPGAIRPDFWREKIRFWEANIDYEQYARINFTAAAELAKRLVPAMIDAGWGRIINVTTSLVTMLNRGCSPYGPTKAALEALTSVQSHDLEGTGVTANVLIPGGATDTPMVPANPSLDRATLIQPQVMAPVARWLSSPLSDSRSGRRYLASQWDGTLADELAAQAASAPIGWPT